VVAVFRLPPWKGHDDKTKLYGCLGVLSIASCDEYSISTPRQSCKVVCVVYDGGSLNIAKHGGYA